MPHRENVGQLLREVATASGRLKHAADALHRDLGVTAAMRGIVELLAARGAQTVPQLARQRAVTRQHVQGLVTALVKRGHCVLLPNPGHARSPLVGLTGKGRAVVETLRECEHAALGEISSELPGDVMTALAVLRRLNAALLRRS